jgi:hypothetical protein
MQQSRTRAVHALKGNRNFSTSTQRLAVSPFRRPAQAVSSKITQEDAKRPQSTAAAAATQTQSRSRPSPAFNREDYKDVQPLKQYRSPAMDHSFVGMTGGEIFHEMMLRQGVKHICMTSHNAYIKSVYQTPSTNTSQSATPVVRFSPSSMPSTSQNTSTSSFHDMNRVPATWQRVTPARVESPVLSSLLLDPVPPTSSHPCRTR